MDALIALVILIAFALSVLVLAWRHPLGVLVGLVVVALATSCSRSEAAPLDHPSVAVTSVEQSSGGGVPTGTNQGGGGALDWVFIATLVGLAIYAALLQTLEGAKRTIVELRAEVKRLQPAPPADAILSISSVEAHAYDYAGHRLVIGFATYSAMNDFGQWITLASQAQRTRAQK